MPRLRPSILSGKWRKQKLFSKFRQRNKPPSPGVVNNDSGVDSDKHSESDLVGTTVVPVYRTIDDWQQLTDWFRHQSLGLGHHWFRRVNNRGIILKLANVSGTVYMIILGRNLYMASSWDVYYARPGGKQTYFTPAPWASLMWPVIHALMLGGCIYQFSRQGTSFFVDEVGWKLPLLWISNAMYIRCRSSYRYKSAFVWSVVTYLVVNKIYKNIRKLSPQGIRDRLFCFLSFSLYHGWILGLMFLAGFEAFGVDAVTTPAGISTKIFILFSFVLIQLFERAYASPATDGDFFACLTISWFLFAITVEQSIMRSTFSHWTAHGFTLFSLWWLTKCMIGSELRLDKKISFDEEHAPLIA